MIVRSGQVAPERRSSDFGTVDSLRIGDAGGLTQFGALVQVVMPGARTSERHWHEQEDEFVYVLAGEITVTEDDGDHLLRAGDAACWPAGVANAHRLVNRSDAPCTVLVVGTRLRHDVCHYPDVDRTLYSEGDTWRLVDAQGQVLREGRL